VLRQNSPRFLPWVHRGIGCCRLLLFFIKINIFKNVLVQPCSHCVHGREITESGERCLDPASGWGPVGLEAFFLLLEMQSNPAPPLHLQKDRDSPKHSGFVIAAYTSIGFTWQGFGSRGLQGWRLWEQSRQQPAPDSSKRAPALARAEPISDVVCTSGRADVSRGKYCCTTEAGRARSEKQPCSPQGECSRRQEVLQAHSSSSPAGCAGRGPWWSRLSPCTHGSPMEQISTLLPPCGWRSPRWSRWLWPGGGCGLWRAPAGAGPGPQLQPWRGAPAGAGGLGGAAAQPWGTRAGAVCSWGMDGWMEPVGRSRVGAVLEELLPVGSPCGISWGRAASHGRDPTGSRGREGPWGSLCWVCFARHDTCWAIALSLSQPWSPLHRIFSPFPFEEGEWESGRGGTRLPTRFEPPQLQSPGKDFFQEIKQGV